MSGLARRIRQSVAARVICARLVRETPAFFWRELVRPPGTRLYVVRANGLRVALRHRGVDAATLAEVFRNGWYELPSEVGQALGSPRRILDLGANVGFFGAFAAVRWPEAEIIAYEPDPDNAAVHEQTIAVNGLAGRWHLVRAAAGAQDATVRLAAGRGPSSFVLAPDATAEVEVSVPERDVLPEVSASDLVKIDIEGGEWAIIGDPRFAADPPRVVVLEYHPGNCPGPDPLAEAVALLAAAGMRTAPIGGAEREGFGMLWGWR